MIAGIKGTLTRMGPGRIYIEANGIEYEVHVPLSVQSALSGGAGEEPVALKIYHHITDSDQRLFGFQSARQREFFVALQSIKGLGTVLALSLMSHLDAETFLDYCGRKDVKALCHIPRVGKTTAETLIFEVNRKRDKWQKLLDVQTSEAGADFSEGEDLAMQALIQLGYKEKEALAALAKVRKELSPGETLEAAEWISRCLRIL